MGDVNGRSITVTSSNFQNNAAKCVDPNNPSQALCGYTFGGGLVAISNSGTVTLSNDVFDGNSAWNGGGAFTNQVNVSSSAFKNNSAGYGGGLYADGAVDIQRVSFTANSATNYGAGIYATILSPSISINNALFSNNQSGFANEGEILQLNAGATTLENVAVVGSTFYWGAAVEIHPVSPTPSASLNHVTVNGITSTAEVALSGIRVQGVQNANIQNTIVANFKNPNPAKPQFYGVEVYPGFSATIDHTLFYNNDTNTGGGGTVAITNPVPGNPAFAVDGYHLTQASQAIDQGVVTGLTTDIDGDLRDSKPDVGADEFRVHAYIPKVSR